MSILARVPILENMKGAILTRLFTQPLYLKMLKTLYLTIEEKIHWTLKLDLK